MDEETTDDDVDLSSVCAYLAKLSDTEVNSLEGHGDGLKLPFDEDRSTISGKKYPSAPSTVKFVNVGKAFENHTYRDFTNIPKDDAYSLPVAIEEMSFHEKLYHLLSYNPTTRDGSIIGWCLHGRAFQVKHVKALESLGTIRCYFGFNSFKRFRKQLRNNGYKHISKALGGNCYYSEVGLNRCYECSWFVIFSMHVLTL